MPCTHASSSPNLRIKCSLCLKSCVVLKQWDGLRTACLLVLERLRKILCQINASCKHSYQEHTLPNQPSVCSPLMAAPALWDTSVPLLKQNILTHSLLIIPPGLVLICMQLCAWGARDPQSLLSKANRYLSFLNSQWSLFSCSLPAARRNLELWGRMTALECINTCRKTVSGPAETYLPGCLRSFLLSTKLLKNQKHTEAEFTKGKLWFSRFKKKKIISLLLFIFCLKQKMKTKLCEIQPL